MVCDESAELVRKCPGCGGKFKRGFGGRCFECRRKDDIQKELIEKKIKAKGSKQWKY